MKLCLISLGCAKNLVDSEAILGLAKEAGFTISSSKRHADCFLINTCGFIESAKMEAIETIHDITSYRKPVIVTGCFVQRYLKECLEEFPEVDFFVPIRDYPKLCEIFAKILDCKVTNKQLDFKRRICSTDRSFAYLKISEGCDNRCSYCAIPLIRGCHRSTPLVDLIEEAKVIRKLNRPEICLIAQDTTRYGIDINSSLSQLLNELSSLDFPWIRVLYMYPDEISMKLLETMKDSQSILPYFDIPIQHASDRILKAMNRRGTKAEIINLIKLIRSTFSNPIIRTTLIVGYPDETEEDFNELLDFISEMKFNHLGVFGYSDEEDTPGFDQQPKVPQEIIDKRVDQVMLLQQRIAFEYNHERVGKTYQCVISRYNNITRTLYLRSFYEATEDIDGAIIVRNVDFETYTKIKDNPFVNIEIIETVNYDLFGKIA